MTDLIALLESVREFLNADQRWAEIGDIPSRLDAAIAELREQKPVFYAEAMSGTNGGFTMAVFNAADIPIGTPLYAAPIGGSHE